MHPVWSHVFAASFITPHVAVMQPLAQCRHEHAALHPMLRLRPSSCIRPTYSCMLVPVCALRRALVSTWLPATGRMLFANRLLLCGFLLTTCYGVWLVLRLAAVSPASQPAAVCRCGPACLPRACPFLAQACLVAHRLEHAQGLERNKGADAALTAGCSPRQSMHGLYGSGGNGCSQTCCCRCNSWV